MVQQDISGVATLSFLVSASRRWEQSEPQQLQAAQAPVVQSEVAKAAFGQALLQSLLGFAPAASSSRSRPLELVICCLHRPSSGNCGAAYGPAPTATSAQTILWKRSCKKRFLPCKVLNRKERALSRRASATLEAKHDEQKLSKIEQFSLVNETPQSLHFAILGSSVWPETAQCIYCRGG